MLVVIRRNNLATVRWMLSKGELARPVNDNVTLHVTDNLDMLRLLIDGGVQVDKRGDYDLAPLHNAARKNSVAVARLLLASGADVNNVENPQQATPIFWARSVQMVRLLVEAGADLTLVALGFSLLDYTAAHRDVAIVEYLINVSMTRGSPFPRALLHRARVENAKLLIRALDSDVDWVSPSGCFTALHAASSRADNDLLRFLLVCGASVDSVATIGANDLVKRTAIDMCKSNEAAALLLAAGAQKGMCKFDPSADEIAEAACRLARERIDLIRARAFDICLALDSLELPALLMCAILEFACAPFAACVPFHSKWNIVVAVKHRQPFAKWSSARSSTTNDWVINVDF